MKKLIIILLLSTGLVACENQKNDFPDFNYTACYFPYQYPVRTLVLGDDIYDNTNDNNHKFLISATFGGVYSNKTDRELNIALDNSLGNNVRFGVTANDTIRLMPSAYYTLSSNDKIIIPKDQFDGSIEVQLTDAFFNDPLAIGLKYIIPLRIVGTADVDSILSGKTTKTNPDRRKMGDWDILPKDFTMFAVKFINPYHGSYLHRGITVTRQISTSAIIDTKVYHQKYVVDDEVRSLFTSGRNQVQFTGVLRSSMLAGALKMYLNFTEDDNCTITDAGSAFPVTGTGKFVKNGDTWGNKPRNVLYLNYTTTNGVYSYNATDTLVVRDRAVTMQVYSPVVFAK